jgi:hypothetical protein
MINYVENKKKIEAIRDRSESMFRMAISHLMDVGVRHLTDENIENTCKKIMQEDDSKHFMTNEFKCDLIKTAGELAKINNIDLLAYISNEVYYDTGDDRISYERAIQMVQNCINWITCEANQEDAYSDLISGIGFDSEELEKLGYGYLINEEEDDE